VGIVLAITMNAFEAVAVVTAMPAVADALDGDALYGATFSAYMLANLVALVATGELSDRLGPARPFAAGLCCFASGLAIAGLAPTMLAVVVGRVLQGAGGGALYSVAYVAVGRGYPPEQRARVFAWLSAAWVIPSLLGPLLAGAVTEHLSWRLVFLGLLPLLPVLVALTLPALRRLPPVPGARPARSRIPDAMLLATGVGVALAGLQSRRLVVMVPVALIGVALAARPLVRLLPAGVFRAAPGLPATAASRGLVNAAFFGTDTFIPLAVTRLHGASTLAGGFMIVGASLTWTVGSVLQARRGDRWHPGRAVAAGFATVAVGIAAASVVLAPGLPYGLVFPLWAIAGLGMGVVFNVTAVVALAHAPEGTEGVTSSQLQLADALGFAVAGSVVGAILAAGERAAWTVQGPLAIGFGLAFVTAVLGVAAGWRVRRPVATVPVR
jgi:MFS family permease